VQSFNRAVDAIIAALRVVIVVQATGIFAIAIFAVVARYIFGGAVSWSEEVPRYLLIWISFLGAAICVDRKEHIAFDILYDHLAAAPRAVLAWIINLLMLAFGFVMFWWGIVFVEDFGGDLMETIPFKNYWYYVAMPISGALIVLFIVRNRLNAVFAIPGTPAEGSADLAPGRAGLE
jgi:TRAP-type transport system small permease protein